MEKSSVNPVESTPVTAPHPAKGGMVWWFAAYAMFLATGWAVVAHSYADQPPAFGREVAKIGNVAREAHPWYKAPGAIGIQLVAVFREATPSLKLLLLVMYCGMATTFLPMPVNAFLAAAATKAAGISDNPFVLAAEVCTLAAAASTIANMTDYHIFLLLLKSKRIARIRDTRTYSLAAKWFAKSPFMLLTVFNFIPIPVDVVRMLSAIYGYSRILFAAANFIGRFIRYLLIVWITVLLGEKWQWLAPVVLLGVAIAIVAIKAVPAVWRKLSGGRTASGAQ